MTELGYDMQPYSQALGNYNKPTKQFERLVLSNSCVIDKNECVLWCFNNVTLKADHNDNVKPIKGNTKNGKIDCVISMLTALGGYLSNPQFSNEIWVA
jgi:phage terminase large subunit-like protein